MTDSTSTKIEYLRSLGCMEVSHSGETLYKHLLGVQRNLKDRGAPEYLQDAGLFHSVYGTLHFTQQSTKDRNKVRELIGEQAEEIVFMFNSLKHPRFDSIHAMEPSQLKKDLLILAQANQDEQKDRTRKMMNWDEAYDL